MGKYFEALKRGQSVKAPPSSTLAPKEPVKISPERIDALRLDLPTSQRRAEVPPISNSKMDSRLICFMETRSVASECFKLLRSKILRRRNSVSPPRSIMVTSAQPWDGKSTVAVNLAINIAQGINEYVILADCDLRRPSLDTSLGLNVSEGIREYLEEGTSVAPYLMKTPVKKLTLLPAGKPPSKPSELLSSEKMRLLLQELKNRYEDRYLILDCTPAQFGAETMLLASMVDSVLLVVRAGRTNKDMLLEAIDNIGRERILGLIFNACDEIPKGYSYYNRYYGKAQR